MAQAIKRGSGIESTLGALVAHPTRVESYVILAERVASPNEIAMETNKEVSHVSYHVRKLEKFGFIELVDERAVRGANEHFYRAVKRPFASDAALEEMSPEEVGSLTRYTLQLHLTDAVRALDAGTFDARLNRWLVRLPMQVDEDGFSELADLHREMYERKLQIQAASAERIASEGTAAIPTVDTAMFFEMPPRRAR